MDLQQLKSKRAITIMASVSTLVLILLIAWVAGVFQSEREKRLSFSGEHKVIKMKTGTVKRITMPQMPAAKQAKQPKPVPK